MEKKKIKLKEFYEFYNKIYKTDVKINGCKDKCALTNIPDNLFEKKEHMTLNKQNQLNFNIIKQINSVRKINPITKINSTESINSVEQFNSNNFMSIIFFGIIIALSLYMYRIIQLKIMSNK